MNQRFRHPYGLMALALSAVLLASSTPAFSQAPDPPGTWRIEASTGLTARTMAGSVFSMGGGVDYLVTEKASVGTMLSANSGVDLTQYSVAAVTRYKLFSNGPVSVFPLVGVGYTHFDHRGVTSSSVLVPAGANIDYTVGGNTFSLTVLGNLHPVDVPGVKDNGSVSVMIGVRQSM